MVRFRHQNRNSWSATLAVMLSGVVVGCSASIAIDLPTKSCIPKPQKAVLTESRIGETSLGIVGGSVANSNDELERSTVALQAIYEISALDDNGQTTTNTVGGTCTAVIAAKNVIITAAHCFDPPRGQILRRAIGVTIKNDLKGLKSGDFIGVKSYVQHPQWNQTFHDIAVAQLNSNLPDPFIPARFELDASTLQPQTPVVLIGYGITGENQNDSGLKRRTESALDKIINKENFPMTSIVNQIRVLDITGKARGACRGDSGGPGFIKETSKVFGIVQGINATVQPLENMSCAFGDANYTLVAPYKDWVEQAASIKLSEFATVGSGNIPTTQTSNQQQVSDKLTPCE